ncbi:MAG TPA: NAD-dependent epimerase/dehydratase family protein [Gemmatimonadales bacterium]|nr:NAD-dependent epimerase/dehydratase family protein [Gemmatimonadales bacterium]
MTGATGFVGSHLVEALRQDGHHVAALVRNPVRAANLAGLDVEHVPGNLGDPESVARAVRGRDVIFHVAGLIAARSEAEYLLANRDGTRAVARAAELARVDRLIYVSSMAAAGPAVRGRPLTGTEPAAPVTAYGRSKLEGERVIRECRLRWSIVRPPVVYGPRDREVLKVFQLARVGLAPVFGDGTQELSAVHAADLARALIATAGAPATIGGTYYACHPEIVTSGGFVRAVARAAGKRVTMIRIPLAIGRLALAGTGAAARIAGRATLLNADKANEFFQAAWTGDAGPLTRDSGWQARYDLASGLADTWEWYRRSGWL